MTSNSYSPPTTDQTLPRTEDHEVLSRIASSQRLVIYSILGYFALIAWAALAGSVGLPKALTSVISVALFLAVALMGLYGAATLAYRLLGVVGAVICGVLLFVPLVGLLTLILLSGQANKRFKKAGIRVGFLGVPASEFAKP